MDRPRNTPLHRLHRLMMVFREHLPKRGCEAVASVFPERNPKEYFDYYRGVADLFDLLEECSRCAKLAENAEAGLILSLTPFHEVLSQLTFNQGTPGKITDSALAFLMLAANEVCKTVPEFEIQNEELKATKAKLYDARKQLEEAVMDETLRKALLLQIQEMLDTVQNYRVFGAPGFRAAAGRAYGEMFLNAKIVRGAQSEVWAIAYLAACGAVADLWQIATLANDGASALAGPVLDLLLK